MYRFTLMLVRDHTERTGRDTRDRQVREITRKALVSARARDWESTFRTDRTDLKRAGLAASSEGHLYVRRREGSRPRQDHAG